MGPERDMSQPAGDHHPPAYPAYPGPADPRPPRPPLTKRMRRVHWIAVDCVVAGGYALSAAALASQSFRMGNARLLLSLLFMAVIFIPVAFRRRAPATAFGALVILGVLLSGLMPTVPAVIFLAAAYVLYTVTVEGRRRTGAAALALILAVMVVVGVASGTARPHNTAPGNFVPVALANVIAWMTGYSVRQRRLYVVTLQQQAANSAVAEERLRIARELHDVVAHSMSVIAVQAGYGQYVIETSPDGAKDALGAIQATSRDALEEMRRMLGVLRQQDVTSSPTRIDPAPGQPPAVGGGPGGRTSGSAAPGSTPGGGAPGSAASGGPAPSGTGSGGTGSGGTVSGGGVPLAPAPGLAGLERLIGRTRGAGVRVTLEVSGHARPAPAGVDLSAYRIIQEALTNVVKHAGTGAACVVGVRYTDADLVIRVTDNGGLPDGFAPGGLAPVSAVTGGTVPGGIGPLTAAGTGHGIIGMRERVILCGGTFNAGQLPDGGFQVTAALPLPAGYPAESAGYPAGTAAAAIVPPPLSAPDAASAAGPVPFAGPVPSASTVSSAGTVPPASTGALGNGGRRG